MHKPGEEWILFKTRYCITGENIAEKLPFFKNIPWKDMKYLKVSLILPQIFFEEKKISLKNWCLSERMSIIIIQKEKYIVILRNYF